MLNKERYLLDPLVFYPSTHGVLPMEDLRHPKRDYKVVIFKCFFNT